MDEEDSWKARGTHFQLRKTGRQIEWSYILGGKWTGGVGVITARRPTIRRNYGRVQQTELTSWMTVGRRMHKMASGGCSTI